MHSSNLYSAMAFSDKPPSLSFRSDIQGLRAIAVVIVVACHANIPGFSGGYIGVDIFFVLSGFLISGLLLKESKETGTIHFLRFYARRFKRLLPALILMLTTTIIAIWFLLAPFEQVAQVASTKYVPFWLSNIYYSFSDIDYFGQDASNNVFLHTWSLGVEEQFYLVWPLLISAVAIFGKKFNLAKSAFYLFISIGLLSLSLSLYWSFTNLPLAFYLMPSRAWQFALGGLACLLGKRIQTAEVSLTEKQAFWIGPIGLGLIFIATYFYHDNMVYPGSYAFIPSVGAAGILMAGSAPEGRRSLSFLSSRPFQFLGNISYSWYLWHWPVLVLGTIVLNDASLAEKLWLLLFSLLIASIAYYLVENPIRHSRHFSTKPAIPLIIACSLMGITFAGISYWGKNASNQSAQPEQLIYQQVRSTLPVIYSNGCDDWFNSSRVLACAYGSEDAENTAILFGDSIGAQWFSAFARPFIESGWRFIVYTKSSCPITDVSIFYERIGRRYTECEQWRAGVISTIKNQEPDILLIGSSPTYSLTEEDWRAGTKRILEQLSTSVSNTYIIRGSFQLHQDGPSCLARKQWQPTFIANVSNCDSTGESAQDALVLAGLTAAISEFPNVHLLDLNSINCPDNVCSAVQNNYIVYRDFQHLSDIYVNSVSAQVIDKLSEASSLSTSASNSL